MSAPNIVNVATINGKTAVLAVPATVTAMITNAAASSTVLKVNALYISNITAGAVTVTAEVYRSTVSYRFAYAISIPAASTLDVISKSIYLEEGDTLRLTASAGSSLEAVASYEVLA